MRRTLLFTVSVLMCLTPLSQQAQSKRKKKKDAKTEVAQPAPKKKNGKIKPYDKVITSEAISDDGVFTVHKVGEKYYFEIPNEHLGKDMLLVSRIAKLPSGLGGGYVNAGSKTAERLIAWERFDNKVLIKERSFNAVADEELPISISVKSNNYEPTIYAFDIAAFSKDSSAVVVDVTKFYSTDVKAISGLPARFRTTYKVRNLDASRSFITGMKSFPKNIEVIQDMTYNASQPPSAASAQTPASASSQPMRALPRRLCPRQPIRAPLRRGATTARPSAPPRAPRTARS